MARRGWRRRFRGVPVLGGVAELIGTVMDVYDAIGWSDSTYGIGMGQERLAEARRVAEAGTGSQHTGGTAHARPEPAIEEGLELLQGGQETILVVDDDPLQRRALQTGLNRLGYAAAVVASGEEALAYLQEHEVDLLVLDMVMPGGMDGAETYRQIVKSRPAQRAIVMSGLTDTERIAVALSLGVRGCLDKPVTLEKLAEAVRQELDR